MSKTYPEEALERIVGALGPDEAEIARVQEEVRKAQRKLRPLQRKFIREYMGCGFNVKMAAEKAGIGQSTGYMWMTLPEMKKALELCCDAASPLIEARHIEAGLANDTLSRIHYLKHRSPRYRETPIQVEHKRVGAFSGEPPQGSAELAVKALEIMREILAGGGCAGRIEKDVTPEKVPEAEIVRSDVAG